MTLYSYNGSYPQPIPHRIKLSDGRTRTDPSTFTDEEIIDAGYTIVSDMPIPNSVQVLEWDSANINWVIRDKTLEELQAETNALWSLIRAERDKRIADVMWRYERYERYGRLGLEQTDDITKLDKYIQDLADLPQTQDDPYDILWPVLQRAETSNTQEIEDVVEQILDPDQLIS
jgi:hypothetical protein